MLKPSLTIATVLVVSAVTLAAPGMATAEECAASSPQAGVNSTLDRLYVDKRLRISC